MQRKVNPTSNFFVRFLLGLEEHKSILLDFINTILLDSDSPPMVELEIKNPFNLEDNFEIQESTLDLKARDSNGRLSNIEIQVIDSDRFVHRSLFYRVYHYRKQLDKDKDNQSLSPIICINLLNYILFHDMSKAHRCFIITEKISGKFVLNDDLQIHYLELPRMEVGGSSTLTDRLEKWAFFFKNEGLLEEEEDIMKSLLLNDPVMKQAHNVYRRFTADDAMLEIYMAHKKRLRDRHN